MLGSGAMATVWRARHVSGIGLEAAVKRLHPHCEVDAEMRSRFRVEAEALARLQHPNLVRLLDYVEDDAGIALITEVVDGRSLSKVLSALADPMPWADVVELFTQIVRGVDHAHRQGCLHRDLKPANVMVGADGTVKVLDFGIASLVGADRMTEVGFVMGTPAYMAPEQRRSMQGLDARADVFALGVLLWEMLSRPGRKPTDRDWRIGADDLDALIARSDVPAWLAALVRKMVEPSRTARPPSCRAVLAALDVAVHRDLPPEADPAEQPTGTLILPVDEQGAPLDGPRTNLAAAASSFVGRDAELAAIERTMAEGARLITLCGPGGVGKTRLAERYVETRLDAWPGGAWICELAGAADDADVCTAVADAMSLPLTGKKPAEQLGHALASRGRVLLVLDGPEQSLKAVAALAVDWLARAAEARILITSRIVTHAPGEHLIAVDPLPPRDAVELLIARARAVQPDLDDSRRVRQQLKGITDELDHLPLAIELAASRLRLLSPRKLRERLAARFGSMRTSRGGAESQTTLRAALAWSWELLSPPERAALAHLSVFVGGFTVDAAEAIVDVSGWSTSPTVEDLVARLADHSLLRRVERAEDEPRFDMLSSVRAWAHEQLAQPGLLPLPGGEDQATGPAARRAAETRHGAWFSSFGEPEFLESLDSPGGVGRRRALLTELDNLRVAARRAIDRRFAPAAVDAACALGAALRLQGPFDQGLSITSEALALPGVDPFSRARLLQTRGWLAQLGGDLPHAAADFEEALELLRDLGEAPKLEGSVLRGLAIVRRIQGRMDDARALLEQARHVLHASGDRREEGRVLGNLAVLHKNLGQSQLARRLYREALAIHRQVGNRRSEGIHLGELALMSWELGKLNEALQLYEESLEIHREVGNRRVEGQVLSNLANLHRTLGRRRESLTLMQEALAIHRALGNRRSEGVQLGNLGDLCLEAGHLGQARACLEASLDICRELNFRLGEGAFVGSLGEVAAAEGQLEDARAFLSSGEVLLRDIGNKAELGKLLCRRGRVELSADNVDAARLAVAVAGRLGVELGAGPRSELGRAVADLKERLSRSR